MKTTYEDMPKEALIEKLEFIMSELKSDGSLSSLLSSKVSFEPVRNVSAKIGHTLYSVISRKEEMSFEFSVMVVK